MSDDGGAAFPYQWETCDGYSTTSHSKPGMSLRDYFAASTAAARYAQDRQSNTFTRGEAVKLFGPNYTEAQVWTFLCYEFADAMLLARKDRP